MGKGEGIDWWMAGGGVPDQLVQFGVGLAEGGQDHPVIVLNAEAPRLVQLALLQKALQPKPQKYATTH